MKLAFWRDPAKEQLADDRRMVAVMQKRLIDLDKQKDNIASEEFYIARQLPKIKQRISNADCTESRDAVNLDWINNGNT